MADDDVPVKRNKKKGLAPISQKGNADYNNIEAQPAKRKPKKRATNDSLSSPTPTEEIENHPVPRQRRKRSQSLVNDGEGRETPVSQITVSTPRKKKRKPKTDTENPNKSQLSDPDGQGSKTSLISTVTTPRKKGGKKKKKVKKAVGDVDDFRESPWAEDLRAVKDDIITGNGHAEGETEGEGTMEKEKNKPVISFITAPVLRSQPLDKIFIETSSKFKGQRKSTLMRQRVEEIRTIEPISATKKTTIDFAVGTHKIFRVITLFLHGLTAGLALWQLVIVFLLSSFSDDDFLEHYYRLSLPLQSSYYFLLVLCTVSACDRFDIGNPTPRFVLRALTMQNGAVSILLYLAAFILNIVAIRYDDRMYLYKEYANLFSDNNMKSDEIVTFKGINTARSILIILPWFVLSITPDSDRLGKSLKSGETGLEKEHEMAGMSSA